MLDLVKDETENIDATFLEPACGDGNFLDEVLRRKLAVCRKRYGKSAADYEKFSFLACTTLYGVDIMADNVARCRERLFETWEGAAEAAGAGRRPSCKTPDEDREMYERVARAVKKVFEKNILLGNALSMKRVDEKGDDLDEPIVFTEWKFPVLDKDSLTRKEFRLDVLLEKGAAANGESQFGTKRESVSEMLFDFGDKTKDTASSAVNWMVDPDDPERKRMIPAPSKVYPLIDYWRIGDE